MKKTMDSLIRITGTFILMCGIHELGRWDQRKEYQPQTSPIPEIGDPNAANPNETFIRYNEVDYIGTIDGIPIKDYLENTNDPNQTRR